MEMCTYCQEQQTALLDAGDGSQVICMCFEGLENAGRDETPEEKEEEDEAVATNIISFPSPPDPELIIEAMDSVDQTVNITTTTTTNNNTTITDQTPPPTQPLSSIPTPSAPSRLAHPRSRLRSLIPTSLPFAHPSSSTSPLLNPTSSSSRLIPIDEDDTILDDEVNNIMQGLPNAIINDNNNNNDANNNNNDNENNNNNNDDNNNNNNDGSDDDASDFDAGYYENTDDECHDRLVQPTVPIEPRLHRYAGDLLEPVDVARAAPQAQLHPAIVSPSVADNIDTNNINRDIVRDNDPRRVLRPIPLPLLPPLALRHSIDTFDFDGAHNNDALWVQYNDDDHPDTDADATHFDGYRNNLWTIHATTTYTLTIQNMYTHDTRTQTGTYTHTYRTSRRNHRLQFTQTIPVSFRRRFSHIF